MHRRSLALAAMLSVCAFPVAAQVTIPEEYGKTIKTAETVGALGDNLFGEETSFYTGATTFTATDVSLPGNNAIPVSIGRRYVVESRDLSERTRLPLHQGGFSDWELEIPHLHGVYSTDGWQVDAGSDAGKNLRCTQSQSGSYEAPEVPGTNGRMWSGPEYWQGTSLYIPGQGDQTMMMAVTGGLTKPTDGKQYPWVTNGLWHFSCLATVKNGVGEGFVAHSPQGLHYTFDWIVSRAITPITKTQAGGGGALLAAQGDGGAVPMGSVNNGTALNRNEVWILPTLVEDRFGNSVTYTYEPTKPWQLNSISSNDGRLITLHYDTAGHIDSVSDGTRTWRYEYANGLTAVVLPDNSRWSIDFTTLRNAYTLPYSASNQCDDRSSSTNQTAVTGTITHPSGAVGAFTFRSQMHGRSYVNRICRTPNWPYTTDGYTVYPQFFDSIALTQKTITGPGLSPMQWNYTYGAANASWLENCPTDTSCASTKTVEATEPDGTWTRWTFGNRYKVSEGKLLKVETGTGPTNILRTTATTYQLDPTGMPYPRIGWDPFIRSDMTSENFRPEIARTITQQGRTFNWQVQTTCDAQGTPNANGATICLDQFARSTKVTKFSGTDTRTDATWFEDNLAKWVVGQPKKTTVDGLVESETTYDASTALPLTTSAFGKLRLTAVWNANGTLRSTSDGRDSADTNTTITYDSWMRGIPQLITYPDGYTKRAAVANPGWIEEVTDENGYVTCYGYDPMGRVNSIKHPNVALIAGLQKCGTDYWNEWTRTFAPVAAAEFGLPAGHWRESITTGNMRKYVYYDAMWRPVVTQTYDNADSTNTLTKSVTRYDADGHPVFQAYPRRDISDFNQALKGTRTTYDALGRQTRVEQDAEAELGGIAATDTAYLTGFQTRVANARGKITTTSFKAFDQPTTDWPSSIVGPEGVRTEIVRDNFGKPNSIERHDTSDTVQLTRVYGYNTAQELCRVHEPETGSTYMGYDAAGNLKWSGSGFGPGSACATEAAVAARRSDRTYDNRNRLVDLRFADDTGEQVWTYTPDGLPATITTYNGVAPTYPYVNAYTYDKRRMLVGETGQDGGGFIWRIDNTYDRNGALASNVYPGAQTVDYAPNALGQATKAGTYATGVSYHPNGAIAQFTYGNGVLHVMTQNERLLPDRSRDYNGGIAILDDYYDYDANGNVVAITDGVAGNRGNRDMTYDDLDRLKSTTSAGWFGGTISYTYDVLDNIQSVTRPDANQTYRYCYNGAWQLEFLRIGATTACNTGPAAYALTYDPQGNLYQKNAQRYVFTQDNRLRNVTGLEYYRYDGYGRRTLSWSPTLGSLTYVYGQDGTLRYMQDARRGKSEQYVYLGGSLVAIREVAGSTTTIKYQHTDALGSPAAVTDASRVVVERGEREPYGKLLNRTMHDGPGFTGHAEDAATGLTYMQQRYYDPQIGRFLSVDPVTADGTSGANFNRFWYANDNPYVFVDPDGMATYRLVSIPNGGRANTVVTDGHGGLRLYLGDIQGGGSVVVQGIRDHETTHIEDFYRDCDQTCGIITDAAADQAIALDDEEAGPAEAHAVDVENAYLGAEARKVINRSQRDEIRKRITTEENYKQKKLAKAAAAKRQREEEEARAKEEAERARQERERQSQQQQGTQ